MTSQLILDIETCRWHEGNRFSHDQCELCDETTWCGRWWVVFWIDDQIVASCHMLLCFSCLEDISEKYCDHKLNTFAAIVMKDAAERGAREARAHDRQNQIQDWLERNHDELVKACQMLARRHELSRLEIIKIANAFTSLGLIKSMKLVDAALEGQSSQQHHHNNTARA